MLLGFLRYPKIGFINEELATFRAHDKSITMDAKKESGKSNSIQSAYEDVIEFYTFVKWFKVFKVFYTFSIVRLMRKVLRKNLEIVKRIAKIILGNMT